jgi:hypothetical protein
MSAALGDEWPIRAINSRVLAPVVADSVIAVWRELLRELTIDPSKRYHGTGKPPGPPPKDRT